MNQAALRVYQAVRGDGTQKNVLPLMQTREQLYDYLNYHSFEQKLDQLYASKK
jgi:methylisocitrate lyase